MSVWDEVPVEVWRSRAFDAEREREAMREQMEEARVAMYTSRAMYEERLRELEDKVNELERLLAHYRSAPVYTSSNSSGTVIKAPGLMPDVDAYRS